MLFFDTHSRGKSLPCIWNLQTDLHRYDYSFHGASVTINEECSLKIKEKKISTKNFEIFEMKF